MDIVLIIALIVAGLILFVIEVFLIPGVSLAGIASAACLLVANYFAFSELGPTGGLLTLLASCGSYLLVFIWFIRSKSIDRLALHQEIDSTVAQPAGEQVQPGDTGIAITRLALIGNADLNGRILEVKSCDGFLNEKTHIIVDRIQEGVIFVRKDDSKVSHV